jgi:hypothetical protein
MRPNPDFRATERAVHQARAQLGLKDDPLRPERPTLTDRLREPPERDRGLGRDHGVFFDR